MIYHLEHKDDQTVSSCFHCQIIKQKDILEEMGETF
jgi:hypothetical protein